MKIVNIDGENLYVFWATLGISIKFLGKMWLIMILKVTENQGFTLYIEHKLFKKLRGIKLIPQPLKG